MCGLARFKCGSMRNHVMVNANTDHYCDLSIFLPTSFLQTHIHTHTVLTWKFGLGLNQCHACHISCQRSTLSCDVSPPLISLLHPLSPHSLSPLILFFFSYLFPPLFLPAFLPALLPVTSQLSFFQHVFNHFRVVCH